MCQQQLPPLMELRSSLIHRASSNRNTRKPQTNTSEPKLRKHVECLTPSAFIFDVPSEDAITKLIMMLVERGKRVPEAMHAIPNERWQEFVESHLKHSRTVVSKV